MSRLDRLENMVSAVLLVLLASGGSGYLLFSVSSLFHAGDPGHALVNGFFGVCMAVVAVYGARWMWDLCRSGPTRAKRNCAHKLIMTQVSCRNRLTLRGLNDADYVVHFEPALDRPAPGLADMLAVSRGVLVDEERGHDRQVLHHLLAFSRL
jgi:hypothetical protein